MQGIQGTQGLQGLQGLAGFFAGQGAQGSQGPQGPQGLAGLFAGQGAQGAVGTVNITPAKTSVTYSAIKGQTTFAFTYFPGYIEVFVNGSRLTASEYTATDGLNVILNAPSILGDTIDLINYTMGQGVQGLQGPAGLGLQGTQGLSGLFAGQGAQGSTGLQGPSGQGLQGAQGPMGIVNITPSKTSVSYTASANQTTFAFTYYPGYVEVFVNGSRLSDADFVATNGTQVILNIPAYGGEIVDLVQYTMGQGVQGIRGAGTQGVQGLQGEIGRAHV